MEIKEDHVAVTLPIITDSEINQTNQKGRRSIRRYWNQLPRCQRNLIILAITTVCVTLLFFLPGDDIITESTTKDQTNHINIAPLKEELTLNKHLNIQNTENQERHKRRDNKENVDDDNLDVAETTLKLFENNHSQFGLSGKKSLDLTGGDLLTNHNQVAAEISNVVDDPNNLNNDLDLISIGPNKDEQLQQQLFVDHPGIDEALNRLEENFDSSVPKDFKGPSNNRQKSVVNAFKHSWKAYKEFAWGHDNLKPLSMSSFDWFGLGLTIVDSLDTLYIMDLQEEFDEARNWIDQYLSFDVRRDVNLFEVTIRVLGGLLSAYHLSSDKMFLKKSTDLGNRLIPCFNSPSGIPYSDVNLASMSAHSPKWSPDSSTSEATTLQLEFRDLSRTTGNNIYEKVVHRVNQKVHSLDKPNGLVPIFINPSTGNFRNFATISLGARGDSYYEYLLKQWIQTGRKENDFLIMDYMAAIDGVISQLVRQTPKEHYTYIGELYNGKEFKPKMDHLTCYLPGTLILGHKFGMPDTHLTLARDLLETCYQTYIKQPTGLAPEITYFSMQDPTANDLLDEPDIQVKSNDAHNLLRPEFIESLYYFYSITGNRTYQDMGWNIFQSFEKYTKVKNGYTSIGNVKNVLNTRPRDMMESFWLGETLKYFYLLFSDDRNELDLEKYVLNTEAHPIPIRNN